MRTVRPPNIAPSAVEAQPVVADVRICLLGECRITVGARLIPATAWRLSKARSLMQLLALAPGHTLHREQVMDALWPEADPRAAAGNYRQVVHAARRALESGSAAAANGSPILRIHQQAVSLEPAGRLWIDVDAFTAAAAAARHSGQPAAYRAALDLYAGDLLPTSLFEDWLVEPRAALHELAVALHNELAAVHEQRGEVADASAALQRLTSLEPAHEAAHAGLMRLYARTGEPALALRQYSILREALRRHLDAEPDVATRQLHDDIVAGRLGRASTATAPAVPAERDTLPKPLTSFIGREADIAQVMELLSSQRLVTLSGAGGCGKSRLALAVAARLRPDYPDGVVFVELAALADARLVPKMVAVAFGVSEQPRQAPVDALVSAVRERRLLLVLDNCEHVSEACAELAAALLANCPALRILATSRERLRLDGEVVWRVPPLSLPRPDGPPTPDQLLESEAARLFVERARLQRPDFTLDQRGAAAVADICRRLDGLPLAIELAAARSGVLGPEELAARLHDALRLLVGGGRATPPRQQTLRATLDWSYAFLNGLERAALRRLSVFAGGWSLAAAEAVIVDEQLPRDQVLDLLASLAERSLAQVDDLGSSTRYRLLETVRQYAWEQLRRSGEADAASQRHAEYFATLADAAEPALRGPDQAAWLARLDQDVDNVRAALVWARDRMQTPLELRLCWGVWRFWNTRGYLSEGRGWLREALALPHDANDDLARVGILFAAARFAMLQSDDAQARALAEECRVAAEKAGDDPNLSGALTILGHVHMRRGELEEARQAHEAALAVRRTHADTWAIAVSLGALAHVARAGEQHVQAAELYDAARASFVEVGDAENAAIALYGRGMAALDLGRLEEATHVLEDSLTELRAIGNRLYSMECVNYLAHVALARRDSSRARDLLTRSLTSARELRALRLVALGLEGFAILGALDGQALLALTLGAAAEGLRARIGEPLPRADLERLRTALAAARETLEPDIQAAAAERGRLMRQDQAVALALASGAS